MNTRLSKVCIGVLMALPLLVTGPASGDEINRKTIFQFDAPVEIPGRVLAPGKYVFQIVDTADLNVVQVYAEDAEGHDHMIDTIAAIPEYIENTPNMPFVNFQEQPGHRKAIRSWFAAGDNWGWKFSYPKDKTQ